ncbi:MAG: hypothetical protein HYU66_14605, partial [Armatimonadetes bacterium]|nr:hypothetical protein [Armatimonadota bacterium]
MPDRPDVLLEDCTLVSQQCALKGSNYGFHTSTRVALRGCRLLVNNFSQPGGEPSKGVIQSVEQGKLLAVELTDCLLMGYKLCGVMVHPETAGDIQVTTHGDVRAYVQYQQEVPAGIFRLPDWPVEAYAAMAPPDLQRPSPYVAQELVWKNGCELSPFLWHGRLCHMHCQRPPSGGKPEDHVLIFRDAVTGEELGRCGQGYSLGSCIVWDDTLYVYASRWENGTWNDVTLFRSKDLKQWDPPQVVVKGENEGLFNSSVCRGRGCFVMAYESNEATWPAFTTKFATSKDLVTWTKLPRSTFGTNRYTACPCIRHEDGWYYVLYLEHRAPRWRFETYITRSKDLESWELSRANPIIAPTGMDEGINASDPELVEVEGKTWLYYATGDQRTWADVKRVAWPGK